MFYKRKDIQKMIGRFEKVRYKNEILILKAIRLEWRSMHSSGVYAFPGETTGEN